MCQLWALHVFIKRQFFYIYIILLRDRRSMTLAVKINLSCKSGTIAKVTFNTWFGLMLDTSEPAKETFRQTKWAVTLFEQIHTLSEKGIPPNHQR